MTVVKLGDLFACTVRGGTLVAEGEAGKPIHIESVPSGLACNCRCPGCGRRMVAKKGLQQAHHFAHYAEKSASDSCASAGETLLHRFSKDALNLSLEITLPGKKLSLGDLQEDVVIPTCIKFERATLEKRTNEIVPDVILTLREIGRAHV